MTRPLQLLPAVDVVDGRSVRLTRGEASSARSFGDPRRAVADFAEAGAATASAPTNAEPMAAVLMRFCFVNRMGILLCGVEVEDDVAFFLAPP